MFKNLLSKVSMMYSALDFNSKWSSPKSQAPPANQNREDEALIKANENHDDDSRHWPKETETFATSECTRISNEDLGKFHADLEAHLNLKKWLDPARCAVIGIQSLGYITPAFFLLLPRLCNTNDSPDKLDCDIGCEGKQVYINIKLFMWLKLCNFVV